MGFNETVKRLFGTIFGRAPSVSPAKALEPACAAGRAADLSAPSTAAGAGAASRTEPAPHEEGGYRHSRNDNITSLLTILFIPESWSSDISFYSFTAADRQRLTEHGLLEAPHYDPDWRLWDGGQRVLVFESCRIECIEDLASRATVMSTYGGQWPVEIQVDGRVVLRTHMDYTGAGPGFSGAMFLSCDPPELLVPGEWEEFIRSLPVWSRSQLGNERDPGACARQRLVAALASEAAEADKKIENQHYWLTVGFLQREAVNDVAAALAQLAPDLPDEKFVTAMTEQLDRLTAAWRADERDEDGYGVATVHALRRALDGE